MMLTDEEIDALWHEITLPQKVARREILRKGIAANNAKVLADLKPATVDQVEEAYDAWELSGDASTREPMFYLDSQVSALIQDRDALAARVKELNDLLAKSLVTNMQLKATP